MCLTAEGEQFRVSEKGGIENLYLQLHKMSLILKKVRRVLEVSLRTAPQVLLEMF